MHLFRTYIVSNIHIFLAGEMLDDAGHRRRVNAARQEDSHWYIGLHALADSIY